VTSYKNGCRSCFSLAGSGFYKCAQHNRAATSPQIERPNGSRFTNRPLARVGDSKGTCRRHDCVFEKASINRKQSAYADPQIACSLCVFHIDAPLAEPQYIQCSLRLASMRGVPATTPLTRSWSASRSTKASGLRLRTVRKSSSTSWGAVPPHTEAHCRSTAGRWQEARRGSLRKGESDWLGLWHGEDLTCWTWVLLCPAQDTVKLSKSKFK
jgi:hypothetical protein